MKSALRLLTTLALLLPLGVPANAQVSLFGFNWSMTPSKTLYAMHERFKKDVDELVSRSIVDFDDWVIRCEEDFEGARDNFMFFGIELETCEREDIGTATIQFYSGLALNSSNDDDALNREAGLLGAFFEKLVAKHLARESIEDIAASEDILEAIAPLFEYSVSTPIETQVIFSDGEDLLSKPPLGTGIPPYLWVCEGERKYEWALNYAGLNGWFCGDGGTMVSGYKDPRSIEWGANEFSEPWIAFNCTKFDGCGLDDIDIADLLFEDPDIEDQLSPQRGGLRFDIDDFGLCRRAISGERLCVLNGHIILFKGAYQQGQTRQRLTLN